MGPGRRWLGSSLQILQVTLSFMGILKRMSGTRGVFPPSSISFSLYPYFSLTLTTAVTTAGFSLWAWPPEMLGSPLGSAELWVQGKVGYFFLK